MRYERRVLHAPPGLRRRRPGSRGQGGWGRTRLLGIGRAHSLPVRIPLGLNSLKITYRSLPATRPPVASAEVMCTATTPLEGEQGWALRVTYA